MKRKGGNFKQTLYSYVPETLNVKSTKTLNEYGDVAIKTIQIARTPLNQNLENVMNALSVGKLDLLKEKEGKKEKGGTNEPNKDTMMQHAKQEIRPENKTINYLFTVLTHQACTNGQLRQEVVAKTAYSSTCHTAYT